MCCSRPSCSPTSVCTCGSCWRTCVRRTNRWWHVAVASAIVLLIVLVIRPLSVFLMFGRGVLSRHVESRLSVPVPEHGGRGALGTRRRANAPERWRTNDRPPVADLAGERRRVVDGHARRGDPGGRGRDPGDHRRRRTVPRARHHPGHRVRRQRRHAAVAGLDAAAADPAAAALLLQRRPRLRPEETLKAEQVVHDAADEVLAEFRGQSADGIDPRVLDRDPHHHRPALAGCRRDARPRGPHPARRGVLRPSTAMCCRRSAPP